MGPDDETVRRPDPALERRRPALEPHGAGRHAGAIGALDRESHRRSHGVLRVLVGQYLGAKRVPISYAKNGDNRVFNIPRKIDAVIEPVMGADGKEPVVIKNSGYWIAPDIIVSRAKSAKIRDFGRVWDFSGRSAEFCRLEWSGP